MSLYAIGDVQGCLRDLRALLRRINYDADNDRLWFTGDLVNRGPDSLETLRFVKGLGARAQSVLGNHDIYLLMVCNGLAEPPKDGSFDAILDAPDRDELIDWLRRCGLMRAHPELKLALVHAGLPPAWSIREAQALADEVSQALAAPNYRDFLARAYKPKYFGALESMADDRDTRLNVALNIMTRLRFCAADGSVDFEQTGAPGSQPAHLRPWFEHAHNREPEWRVVFGHWSALGFMLRDDAIGLDSGCLWGKQLTAYRLDANNEARFSVPCPAYRRYDKPSDDKTERAARD